VEVRTLDQLTDQIHRYLQLRLRSVAAAVAVMLVQAKAFQRLVDPAAVVEEDKPHLLE
jgi:hypothetical protein